MKIKYFFLEKLFVLFFIFSILIINDNLFAQNSITIEDLKVPISPAFILLGVTPTSIDKPETPKALGVSILNSFNNNINILPKNYSFEVSPYWLSSKDNLTFDEYYKKDSKSVIQNLSFSLATVPLDTVLGGTSLGVGVRTLFLQGKPNSKLQNKYNEYIIQLNKDNIRGNTINSIINSSNSLKTYVDIKNAFSNQIKNSSLLKIQNKSANYVNEYLTNLNKNINDLITKKLGLMNLKTLDSLSQSQVNEILEYVKEQTDEIDQKKNEAIVTDFRELDKKREGILIEFAGALAFGFADDSIKNGKISDFGIWLTPMYSNGNIDLISVLRYIGNVDTGITQSKFDTGLRFLYRNGGFGISLEGLLRTEDKVSPTYRYALNLDYKLTNNIYLTGTFGKNFDGTPVNGSGNGDLITVFGINFGMGSDPIVKLPIK
jgi:hypothetical protein